MSSFLIGIVAAVITMFSWGTGEFMGKKAVDKVGGFKTFFWAQSVALVISGIAFFTAVIFFKIQLSFSWFWILLLIAIATSYVIAYLLAYRAYRIGNLSVVSPVIGIYGLFSSFFAYFFLDQGLGRFQLYAVGIILVGVLMTSLSFESKKAKLLNGVLEAFIASVLYGANAVVYDYILDQGVNFLFVNFMFVLTIIVLLSIYKLFTKVNLSIEKKSLTIRSSIFFTGFFTIFGNFAIAIAYGFGDAILISPISSASATVTVILAFLFLKEKVKFYQAIGISVTIFGVVLAAL